MKIDKIITKIVSNKDVHAKWLNTLSMMENTGSRKISACEHKIDVTVSVLKHASEEARHAYFLKTQIKKLVPSGYDSYSLKDILAPMASYQYLDRLDHSISDYLKNECNFPQDKLRYGSYLLTTYAIEERADELYPIYAKALKEAGSNISVRLIIAEEIGHLEEMNKQMAKYFDKWEEKAKKARELEHKFYSAWESQLSHEVAQMN